MTTFTTTNFSSDEIVPASALQAVQNSLDAICPIGSYLLVHMTPPAGGTLVNGAWLACDGTSVSAGTYVKLFSLIGTTYGGGSGNFNLPDFRGRTPLMAASGGNSDASLGKNDGAALASRRPKHSHTVSSAHTHTASGGTSSGPSSQHYHQFSVETLGTVNSTGTLNNPIGTSTQTTSGESTDHFHTISGTTASATTAVTAVGISGLTDGPAYLVCCTVLIRAL